MASVTPLLTRRSQGRTSRDVPPSARLALMGTLELPTGATVSSPCPRELPAPMAFAALREKPLARTYVAGHLWLDSTEQRAAASLRSALWRLHRAARARWCGRSRHAQLGLAERGRGRARRSSAAAQEMLGGRGNARARRARSGADRLGRYVLPDWYDDWVDTERERFRQIRLAGPRAPVRTAHGRAPLRRGAGAGLAALRAEPLRSLAHRATHSACTWSRADLGEAVRQYETLERLDDDELGVRPSRETSQLIDDGMSARDGGHPRGTPRWRSARRRPSRRRAGRAPRRPSGRSV